MGRVSNNLIGILNFLTLLSIPILGTGIWLAHNGGATECERFLQKPVIALGVLLLVVSLAGLVGACFRVSWLLWVYLLVMFLLIVLLFCFTILAFVVTNPGAGKTLSNRGYKEYRLGDYSNWLQKRVGDGKNWNRIKSCLIDGEVCRSMATSNATTPTVTEFYAEHLSAVQRTSVSICVKTSTTLAQRYGTSQQAPPQPTPIALCGTTILQLCASTAARARLEFSTTSSATGRGWLSSTSYSWLS
uniref:Uncharacterized protein n=1 Tax=Kalanchoe fedtschenkoi TaxID=63787 RepID=A0A7N0U043_KALFE